MDPKPCDICNTVFKPKNTRHRCCSPACGAEAARIKHRKRYSKHLKATHTPPAVKWDRRPLKNDYSHNQYLKEQEMMERPNGWTCRDCGEALTGSQRLRCKECDAIVAQP